MNEIPSIEFESDDYGTVTLICTYVVCPRCEGKGSHVNPAIDGHGISAEEFDRDPDFRQQYMDGWYDVPCLECKRKRVVPEPCPDRNPKEALEAYTTHLCEIADMEAEREMESRMLGEY